MSRGALCVGAIALLLLSPAPSGAIGRGDAAPAVTGAVWINSEPLDLDALRGEVVLVEFWTFACWNCERVEPNLKRWHALYAEDGLVVIAVHTPEFQFERNPGAVRRYVREHRIHYAVAVDNRAVTWRRYANRYWPALYLIDKDGIVRHVRIGEGGYEETERRIRTLLAEPGPQEPRSSSTPDGA